MMTYSNLLNRNLGLRRRLNSSRLGGRFCLVCSCRLGTKPVAGAALWDEILFLSLALSLSLPPPILYIHIHIHMHRRSVRKDCWKALSIVYRLTAAAAITCCKAHLSLPVLVRGASSSTATEDDPALFRQIQQPRHMLIPTILMELF